MHNKGIQPYTYMLVAYFYLSFILLLKNLYLFMNVNLNIVESEKVLKKVFEKKKKKERKFLNVGLHQTTG